MPHEPSPEIASSISRHSSLIPLYRWLVASTLIALVAVLSYFLLPERKERVLPGPAAEPYLYADGFDGGVTLADWVDESKFHFRCTYPKATVSWPYCGMRIKVGTMPEGKDFSRFDRVELKVNYKGPNENLRISLRNFNPAYSTLNDWGSLKSMDVQVSARETSNVIVIDRYEWQVAEYWMRVNKIPRKLSYGEFDHIIDMGIELMPPFVIGEHSIHIEYLDFYGELLPASSWYLGIALLWLLANLLFIARHLFLMESRINDDSKRLSTLARYSDDLKQQSQKYKVLSTTDLLTEALNRNGFAEEMSLQYPDGRLSADTALILIDIDHFKKINDTCGHNVGDEVLRRVAATIRHNVLGSDMLVRWGGEEFVLFCKYTNHEQALLIAEKVRDAVEKLIIIVNNQPIPVTISLGVGIATDQENFDELFHRTDQALYQAKDSGRNCVRSAA